jgi:hypothetical protein
MAVKGCRRSCETKATILLTAESGSRNGRSRGLLRKDPADNSRLLETACFSIELPSIRDAPKFREEGPSGFGLDYFVTLDLVKGCPLFELFGHKGVSARQAYAPTRQFFEEQYPRGIGE